MAISWLELALALVTAAVGQVTYKLYFRAGKRHYLVLTVFFFVLASVCAFLALKQLSIGIVYMSTALSQLLVAGLAWGVLKEPLSRDHGIALALITSGVVLYAW